MKANLETVGVWGRRRYEYLMKTRPSLIGVLRRNGELNSYLLGVNEEAEELFFQTVKETAKRKGITEALKAANQMEWVKRMNSIRNSAEEIVYQEVIYT